MWIAGQNESEIIFPMFAEFNVIKSKENILLEYIGSKFHISDDEFISYCDYYNKFKKSYMNIDNFIKDYPILYEKIELDKNIFIDKCKKYAENISKKEVSYDIKIGGDPYHEKYIKYKMKYINSKNSIQ